MSSKRGMAPPKPWRSLRESGHASPEILAAREHAEIGDGKEAMSSDELTLIRTAGARA